MLVRYFSLQYSIRVSPIVFRVSLEGEKSARKIPPWNALIFSFVFCAANALFYPCPCGLSGHPCQSLLLGFDTLVVIVPDWLNSMHWVHEIGTYVMQGGPINEMVETTYSKTIPTLKQNINRDKHGGIS